MPVSHPTVSRCSSVAFDSLLWLRCPPSASSLLSASVLPSRYCPLASSRLCGKSYEHTCLTSSPVTFDFSVWYTCLHIRTHCHSRNYNRPHPLRNAWGPAGYGSDMLHTLCKCLTPSGAAVVALCVHSRAAVCSGIQHVQVCFSLSLRGRSLPHFSVQGNVPSRI